MSRTFRGQKGPGYEHWKSRYSPGGDDIGKKVKKKTHKRERAKAKSDLHRGIDTNPKY